jgi:hypothetical protein
VALATTTEAESEKENEVGPKRDDAMVRVR